MLKAVHLLVCVVLHCSISRITGFPSFSTLWHNYPTVSAYSGRTAMVDHAGLGTYLYGANTCAIRLSYALIHSGHDINIQSGECNWSGEKAMRATGPYKNAKYIIRVGTMRCYLERTLGAAGIVSATSPGFNPFVGNKGIIVFQDCGFSTATGHVDLYDGTRCINQCYFNECRNIRLFGFNNDREL